MSRTDPYAAPERPDRPSEPDYLIPDADVPTGARDVAAWISEGAEPDDRAERAWAAQRVESERDEQRATVVAAIDRALADR